MIDRIALQAWSMRTPLGNLLETAQALNAGQTAIAALTKQGLPGYQGAKLPDTEEPEDDPGLRILGRHGRLLEPILRDAHDKGAAQAITRERLGLYLAMGMVDAEPHDLVAAVRASRDDQGRFDLNKFFGGAFRQIHPLWPLSMLNNVAAGHFAIDMDIRGDNLVVASDADGGVRAVLEACAAAREQRVDAALVAASSEAVGAFALARASLEQPNRTRILGEGGAAWLLSRQAPEVPHAWILSGATTFGASEDQDGPTQDAWERAIARTLSEVSLKSSDVQTLVCDPENVLLAKACHPWPTATRWSAKPVLGHLGPAAPLVEGMLAVARAASGERILILDGSAAGSAAALLLEAA